MTARSSHLSGLLIFAAVALFALAYAIANGILSTAYSLGLSYGVVALIGFFVLLVGAAAYYFGFEL
jgi:hypothetical protein